MDPRSSIETIKPIKAPPVFTQKLMQWLRLTNLPVIKLYHGYGYENKFFIQGHALALSALPRKRYRDKLLVNMFSLLRLFVIKPIRGTRIQLRIQNHTFHQATDEEGFFKFEGSLENNLDFGWQEVFADLFNAEGDIITTSNSFIFVPYNTQYGFVSDIDDTFLISHSSTILKRLRVLFTNNARTRKPFEGVVEHYKLLARANTVMEKPNSFFYVSSSEWNLYNYLVEFTRVNELPRGIFLLNNLKRLSQLFKTGKNNHHGKYDRIALLMKTFPNQQFILFGDSSQQDPYIYSSLVKDFPGKIYAIYIRDVYKKNQQKAEDIMTLLAAAGVAVCFFKHSTEAIKHSKEIGLIK